MNEIDRQSAELDPLADNDQELAKMRAELGPYLTPIGESGFKLRLEYPVKHGEQEVREVEGRRPQGRHIRRMPMGNLQLQHLLDVFQATTGTATVVIDQMDSRDLIRAAGIIGFFIGGGRLTGPT